MDLEGLGAVLIVGWIVYAAVAWLYARAHNASVSDFLPWWASMLGAAGGFLLMEGTEAFFFLVVALLCLGYGVLMLRARLAPQRELTVEELHDAHSSIRRIVDALQGREPGTADEFQAACDREARALKFSLWAAAICGGLAVAVLFWVSANVRGEVGFGGIIFLIAIGLPALLCLAGLYAALQSLIKMGRYRRLAAEQASSGQSPDDEEPRWRS